MVCYLSTLQQMKQMTAISALECSRSVHLRNILNFLRVSVSTLLHVTGEETLHCADGGTTGPGPGWGNIGLHSHEEGE